MKRIPSIVVTSLVLGSLLPAAAFARNPTQPTAWLGVLLGGTAVPQPGASTERAGVVVTQIFRDSPAAEADLRARDLILAVDGTPVATSAELVRRVAGFEPGAWIPITIARAGVERDLRVRLSTRPKDASSKRLRTGWIGVEFIELPPALREHFGAPADAGTMVSGVLSGSPAEVAGIVIGDVIFEIDGEPVATGAQLERRVAGGGIGNRIEIVAARDGVEIVFEATIDEAPVPEAPAR